jgi:hypothetical protein
MAADPKQIKFDPILPFDMAYELPTIYVREFWAIDWELLTHVHPLEATWSCSPALPVATLLDRYGEILYAGALDWTIATKRSLTQLFIKIVFPAGFRINPETEDREQVTRIWYGIVDLEEDELGAVTVKKTKDETTATAHGQQLWSCYGLEKALADWPLRTSWIADGGAAVEIDRALTFNRDGRPNRTAQQTGDTYLFEQDLSLARYWSTKDIVAYLIKRQTPKDSTETVMVPFVLSGVALPDWDKPEVPQDQASLLSLLNQLIHRRHMLSWRLTVDESTAPGLHQVKVEVFSFTHNDIELPVAGSPKIEKNTKQKSLLFDNDPLTQATMKSSGVAWYDQVIVRGALRLSVGSFSHGDSTLVGNWDTALKSIYDTGASTVAGYSALDDEEKRRRNDEARSSPKLEEIYSLFTIPIAWNRKVKNGEGGAENPMFPDGSGGTKKGYFPDLFVQPTLPLYKGVDYAGSKIADGTTTVLTTTTSLERMAPIVVFKRPGTSRWVAAERMGMLGLHTRRDATENNAFSCSIEVPFESHGIFIRVIGDSQHVIAPTEFARLGADEVLVGNYNWRNAIITIAVPWDEYCEGKYPETLPESVDCPRIKIMDAGDRYRKDYVAPGTVIGIDTNGTLLRSTGGYIPKEGDQDDETQLKALAKLAHAWHGRQHRILTVTSNRLKSPDELDVGDLVTEIGNPQAQGGHHETINVTITQIRVSWPESDGGKAEPPVFQLITDAGELDPIQTAGDHALRFRNVPIFVGDVGVNPDGPQLA